MIEGNKHHFQPGLTNYIEDGAVLFEDTDWLCMVYTPSSGKSNEPILLRDAILTTSGTNVIFDNSYPKTIDTHTFDFHVTTNPGNINMELETYNNETSLIGFDKAATISKINKVDISGYDIQYDQTCGSKFDVLPVKLAGIVGGILFTAAYHEAANAYAGEVPFVYLLQKDQIEKVKKIGGVKFANEFWRKISNHLKNSHKAI